MFPLGCIKVKVIVSKRLSTDMLLAAPESIRQFSLKLRFLKKHNKKPFRTIRVLYRSLGHFMGELLEAQRDSMIVLRRQSQ